MLRHTRAFFQSLRPPLFEHRYGFAATMPCACYAFINDERLIDDYTCHYDVTLPRLRVLMLTPDAIRFDAA